MSEKHSSISDWDLGDRTPEHVLDHSVNCYFCSRLVDERETEPADPFNRNDGGSICLECRAEWYHEFDKDTEPRQCIHCGLWDREIEDWDECSKSPGVINGHP